MPDFQFEISRREDIEYLDGFGEIVQRLRLAEGGSVPRIDLTLANNHPHLEFAAHEANQMEVATLAREKHTAFWPSVVLRFHLNGNASIHVRRESNGRDSIRVDFPDQGKHFRNVLNLTDVVHTVFGPPFAGSSLEQLLPPVLAEFYQKRDETLS